MQRSFRAENTSNKSIKMHDGIIFSLTAGVAGFERRMADGKKISKKKYKEALEGLGDVLTAISREAFLQFDNIFNIKVDDDTPASHKLIVNAFQNVSNIVLRDILTQDNDNLTLIAYERWVMIMDMKRRQCDFNTVKAIDGALDNSMVSSLIQSHQLSAKTREIKDGIDALQLGKRGIGYKTQMAPVSSGETIIPFMGDIKAKMTSYLESASDSSKLIIQLSELDELALKKSKAGEEQISIVQLFINIKKIKKPQGRELEHVIDRIEHDIRIQGHSDEKLKKYLDEIFKEFSRNIKNNSLSNTMKKIHQRTDKMNNNDRSNAYEVFFEILHMQLVKPIQDAKLNIVLKEIKHRIDLISDKDAQKIRLLKAYKTLLVGLRTVDNPITARTLIEAAEGLHKFSSVLIDQINKNRVISQKYPMSDMTARFYEKLTLAADNDVSDLEMKILPKKLNMFDNNIQKARKKLADLRVKYKKLAHENEKRKSFFAKMGDKPSKAEIVSCRLKFIERMEQLLGELGSIQDVTTEKKAQHFMGIVKNILNQNDELRHDPIMCYHLGKKREKEVQSNVLINITVANDLYNVINLVSRAALLVSDNVEANKNKKQLSGEETEKKVEKNEKPREKIKLEKRGKSLEAFGKGLRLDLSKINKLPKSDSSRTVELGKIITHPEDGAQSVSARSRDQQQSEKKKETYGTEIRPGFFAPQSPRRLSGEYGLESPSARDLRKQNKTHERASSISNDSSSPRTPLSQTTPRYMSDDSDSSNIVIRGESYPKKKHDAEPESASKQKSHLSDNIVTTFGGRKKKNIIDSQTVHSRRDDECRSDEKGKEKQQVSRGGK